MVLGSWNPKSTICPFRALKWPFQAPKTLRFKGKMANFEAKNTVKLGKNAKRTNGTHFTRVQGTPHPPGNWRTLPSSQSPSLPTLPLFPHPPGSFGNAPGWATRAGVGEAAHGGGRGGSSKRHLGPDPHLGAFESKPDTSKISGATTLNCTFLRINFSQERFESRRQVGHFKIYGLSNLWFVCKSHFTKTTGKCRKRRRQHRQLQPKS